LAAEEGHDLLGGVGVVFEEGSEPVEQESKCDLECGDGVFFEECDEGVDESWQPLVG
jgi:hypothetical protein